MSARRDPRVFTIAPDAPFLDTFVAALLDGRVAPDLSRAKGPLALARARIFVPTRRSRRALVAAFAAASHGATLLPRIAALGALDEDEPADEDTIDAAPLPPAIGALERRLLLTDLVLAWTRALPGAIVQADGDGLATHPDRPLLVGTSPADAYALAGELGGLIDEFAIEGVDPARLHGLAEAEHDPYWRITLRFLDIAFENWPKLLAERGRMDAAARRVRLASLEAARLAASARPEPMIVLGSTGTNEATARLMAAICRLPNGAVVLPGLDHTMDAAAYAHVGRDGEDAEESAYGHPQAAMKRLLRTLGLSRDDVVELAGPPGPRMRLVSEALRPAETTDAWPLAKEAFAGGFGPALDGVALLEAADEREEALAVAIALRETIETPGLTAALVTPERTLAQRVRAELARWEVRIDDSAGEPLRSTPAGALARLVLSAALEGTDAATLALLAHPAATLGRRREQTAALAQFWELAVCHGAPPSGEPPAARAAAAREGRLHPAARGRPWRWDDAAHLIETLSRALAPLAGLGAAPLARWVLAHRAAVVAVAGEMDGPDAEALFDLFDDPALAGDDRISLDADAYAAFFDRLALGAVVPGPRGAHPRVKILGLLEARLLRADLVVLGGLDEAIWPPAARTSPFLNRPMRAALGLSPPERRIGQTAHDFWMAMGAPRVLVTRAKKRGGSPTTPSRFLQRLSALAGDDLAPSRARGRRFAALAGALDRPAPVPRLLAPAPKPPLEQRPAQLSVTRIETLIRDPYAIFAERILRLQPLGALDEEPGAADQGNAIHEAIEALTKAFPHDLPDDALARLVALADERLAAFHANPSWRAFRRPRLMEGLRFFLDYDRERRPLLATLAAEVPGRMEIPLADGSTFVLTGEADRIEIARDGAARIVDFKTGSPPSQQQIKADLAPQLTLEAAMLEAGAFEGLPAHAVADAVYIRLGAKDGGEAVPIKPEGETFAAMVARHRARLVDLLNGYRDPERGYRSRPMAEWATRFGDYDHLARVKEWSATSGMEPDPS